MPFTRLACSIPRTRGATAPNVSAMPTVMTRKLPRAGRATNVARCAAMGGSMPENSATPARRRRARVRVCSRTMTVPRSIMLVVPKGSNAPMISAHPTCCISTACRVSPAPAGCRRRAVDWLTAASTPRIATSLSRLQRFLLRSVLLPRCVGFAEGELPRRAFVRPLGGKCSWRRLPAGRRIVRSVHVIRSRAPRAGAGRRAPASAWSSYR
jgi:hypothetical protein